MLETILVLSGMLASLRCATLRSAFTLLSRFSKLAATALNDSRTNCTKRARSAC